MFFLILKQISILFYFVLKSFNLLYFILFLLYNLFLGDDFKMQFNERVKQYMTEHGIKQTELVKRTGMSKGNVSNIIAGRIRPNEEFINALCEISNKSAHWWLFGVDEYDNLYSLNELIDFFIDKNDIKKDGSMDNETWDILCTMLKKEINSKLEKIYTDNNKTQD